MRSTNEKKGCSNAKLVEYFILISRVYYPHFFRHHSMSNNGISRISCLIIAPCCRSALCLSFSPAHFIVPNSSSLWHIGYCRQSQNLAKSSYLYNIYPNTHVYNTDITWCYCDRQQLNFDGEFTIWYFSVCVYYYMGMCVRVVNF